MLKKNPEDRPDISYILMHSKISSMIEFFKGTKLIDEMLKNNEKYRDTKTVKRLSKNYDEKLFEFNLVQNYVLVREQLASNMRQFGVWYDYNSNALLS